LEAEGWYVATDGKLRSTKNGSLINGTDIRDVLSAPKGMVPKQGPVREKAEAWALAFHELMCRPETMQPQIQYAIQYLTEGQSKLEGQAYKALVPGKLTDLGAIRVEGEDCPIINKSADLAMAVYHSHSVNAPSPAASALRAALPALKNSDPQVFAKRLIRGLALKKYGAWDKRYAKTRKIAQATGLWDPKLFTGSTAIMPLKFV